MFLYIILESYNKNDIWDFSKGFEEFDIKLYCIAL